mmetsp:Transcript_601/g.1035  ORF Transcript_601/g.1035 Transcript_601/m.1035 type:complete len:591 (+) Transcript_601:76-1848(+)
MMLDTQQSPTTIHKKSIFSMFSTSKDDRSSLSPYSPVSDINSPVSPKNEIIDSNDADCFPQNAKKSGFSLLKRLSTSKPTKSASRETSPLDQNTKRRSFSLFRKKSTLQTTVDEKVNSSDVSPTCGGKINNSKSTDSTGDSSITLPLNDDSVPVETTSHPTSIVRMYSFCPTTQTWSWISSEPTSHRPSHLLPNKVKVFSLNSHQRWEWTESPPDLQVNQSDNTTPFVKVYTYNPDLKKWQWNANLSPICSVCQSKPPTTPIRVYAYNTTTQQYGWDVDHLVNMNLASSSGAANEIQPSKQPIEVYSLDEDSDEWILTSNLVYSLHEDSGEWAWRRVTIEQPPRKKKSLTSKLSSKSTSITTTIRVFSLAEGTTDTYQWSTHSNNSLSGSAGHSSGGERKVFSLQPEGWRWVSPEKHAAYVPPSSIVMKSQAVQATGEKKDNNVKNELPQSPPTVTPRKKGFYSSKTTALSPSGTTTTTPLQNVRLRMVKLYESVFTSPESVMSPSTPSTVSQLSSCPATPKEYTSPGSLVLSFEQVKRGAVLPADVDPAIREMYLDDASFQQLFSMSKSDFSALKKWRKDELKKKIGIF